MVLAYQSGALIDLIPHGPLRKNCILFRYKIVLLCPKTVHMTSRSPKNGLLLQVKYCRKM